MPLRPLVKQKPKRQPDKPENACNDKRGLPTKAELKPDDQRRRNYRADSSSAVEDRHAKRSLPHRKPLGYSFRRARPVARFAQPQHKTQEAQAEQAARNRMSSRC